MQQVGSYVPLGKDNTGGAAILKPFDSSKIWESYDKANEPPKTPLLDSFGDDILKGGAVHPDDRWWPAESQNKFIDEKARIMAKAKAERRDINAEETKRLTALRMEAQDRVSLAQKQREEYIQKSNAIAKDPYAFPPTAKQDLETWWNLGPDKRGVAPSNIDVIPSTSYIPYLQGFGNPTETKSVRRTNSDGSYYYETQKVVNPQKASQQFDELVWPELKSQSNEKARGYIASIRGEAKKAAQKEGLNYDNLPIEAQAQYVHDVAKEQYMSAKALQYPTSEGSGSGEPRKTQSNSDGGTGDFFVDNKVTPQQGTVYIIVDKNGERVMAAPEGRKYFSPSKGERMEAVDVTTLPVVGGKPDQENKELDWVTPEGIKRGSIQAIRVYKKNNKSWDDKLYATITIKDPNNSNKRIAKEIPLTGQNLEKFKREYKTDPIGYLDKSYPDWRNFSDSPDNSPDKTFPNWNELTKGQQDIYMGAWERKSGVKTTQSAPAPAETQSETAKPNVDKDIKVKVKYEGKIVTLTMKESKWESFKKDYPDATRE